MADHQAIVQRLGMLFSESFHVEVPAAEADLLATGLLDSLQLVELLLHLEQQFGVRISIEDIDLDDLRSLERIARVVALRSAAGPAPADQPVATPPSFGAAEPPLRVVERRGEARREEPKEEPILAASLLAKVRT